MYRATLYLEIVFVTVYALQFLIPVLARGFAIGKFTYLRMSIWNVMDFIILLAAIPYLFVDWRPLALIRATRYYIALVFWIIMRSHVWLKGCSSSCLLCLA